MQIHVNGKPRPITPGLTAQGLIEALGLVGKRLAMEVNGEIVPRSAYAGHPLQDGDRVEIVHAIGGG